MLAGLPRPAPPESPPFRGFTQERYDNAQIINLMHAILIAAQRGDLSKAHLEPSVPVAAVDKFKRSKRQTRLKAVVELITGEEG